MGTTETDDLTISFNARRCIHARKCVLGQPKAFVPEKGRDWIQAQAVTTDAMIKVIEACPSGALSYERKDGGAGEATPQVNTVRLWEHGPIELHGNLSMPDGSTRTRAVLCRCGASKSKPYCDNSHLDMKFKASSEPQTDAETADVAIPEPARRADQGRPADARRPDGDHRRVGPPDPNDRKGVSVPLRRVGQQAVLRWAAQGDRLRGGLTPSA